MKLIVALTVMILGYFVYGFYLSQSSFDAIPVGLKEENPTDFYDYRGVINVHTQLSLGSSTPNEVIEDAKKSDLDFVVITDVNQFDHVESLNGYSGNLLVMNEGEYSFLDSRLLYLSDNHLERAQESTLFFTDLLSQQDPQMRESLLIIAHPFKDGPTWTGPFPPGLDGLEIMNPKAIASRAWKRSPLDVMWSFVIYPFNPRYAFLRLFREPTDELSLWDQMSQERPLLGFGGADASARAIPLTDYLIKFPSYQTSFQIVNNHVLLDSELTGRYPKDRQKIMSALKAGQFYVSLDLLGNPKGFIAKLQDKDGKVYPMGSKIKFKPGLKLIAELGREPVYYYEIVSLQNGDRFETVNSKRLEAEITGPGVYRVIVRVSPTLPLPDGTRWITWIYSNPFFIRP
ncbi:MAG: hypothetical protein KF681_11800 [Bdellovibrionaceae bacterium]|nr:hypothetical protein [Pseudobdellovibrionaceae bacterium]